MWLETRPRGERSSLRELVEGIRRLPRARVSWEARVVSPPHGASKVVHVDFIARNEGTEGIPVIPPSYFGDSVHAYPLEADGL